MSSSQKAVLFESSKPNPQISSVEDISPEEVRQKKDLVSLIDVRRPDEWTGDLGHIPYAKHIVLDSLPQKINELPKDKPLVLICRSGARSAQAAAFLKMQGFTSVYNMSGGMIAWNEKNYETDEKNSSN